MSEQRTKFSICIPAYNRAQFLAPLLDSVFSQDYRDFDVIICEDYSRERADIAATASRYRERYPGILRYYENETNLGYDANIRNLVEKATGEFCFFMGNDDVMCPGAVSGVAEVLSRHQNIGVVLKSYAWFDNEPKNTNQEVRYFSEERRFAAGPEAIKTCFRRSGVISGYVVDRDCALAVATSKFDGSLYYQKYLTANVLANKDAVFIPKVLVLCRGTEPYEFGNSASEKRKHTPGQITTITRLTMLSGIIAILEDLKAERRIDIVDDIMRDYANYFYPYIREQLDKLSAVDFFRLYRSLARMGFWRYPMFHAYCIGGYLLGTRNCDSLNRHVRSVFGRSPQFGYIRRAGTI